MNDETQWTARGRCHHLVRVGIAKGTMESPGPGPLRRSRRRSRPRRTDAESGGDLGSQFRQTSDLRVGSVGLHSRYVQRHGVVRSRKSRSSWPRISIPAVLVVGVLIALGPTGPATADPVAEAESNDAAWYATRYGVSTEEAAQFLDLEVLAGQLDAALSKNEADSFGGLWIEHEPMFTVQVRMLPGTESRVDKYAEPLGQDLAALVRVQARDITLEELAKQQAELHKLISGSVDFASRINVEEAQVQVDVFSDEALNEVAQSVPSNVLVVLSEEPEVPMVAIYGGLNLSNIGCTSGFSMVSTTSPSIEGVSTAGHCDNNPTWQGNNLPLLDAQWSGALDAQWHSTPGLTDPNKFNSGIDVRTVLNVYSRAEQAQGSTLCKWGYGSGYHCFTLTNKNYDPTEGCVPNSTSTWMYGYNGRDPNVSDHGDSGGPVFKNNGAYGTVACGRDSGHVVIYMASNYFTTIGARIAEN